MACCADCRALLVSLRAENARLAVVAGERERVAGEVSRLYSISPASLAVRRVPALLATLGLELIGGVVIDQLQRVIKEL